MNSSKKPPGAPPVYRPQQLPKVLQRKTRPVEGQGSIFKASPVRIVQVSGPTPHRTQAAIGRAATIQRAQAPAPQRGAGSSGRSAQQLWDIYVGYDTAQQVKDIQDAFLRNGYTIHNALPKILQGITSLGLDLPAHLSGGAGDGVQGGQQEEVQHWVTQLSKYAADHPFGVRVKAPGQRDSPEEQEARREQKQAQKEKKAVNKKALAKAKCVADGNHKLGHKGVCVKCGQK